MAPCCSLCYEKYICENGALDKDRLIDGVIALCDHLKCNYNSDFVNHIFSNICACPCHKDGEQILH